MSSAPSSSRTLPATATPPAPPPPESPAPRRRRSGLKRTRFAVPRMPTPVRALWAQATTEEQQRAHRAATVILRAWLGKATREEAARELELSPLRFWQLSQQAVAGLVAGCLKQPRARRGRPPAGEPPEEGASALRKRIASLERELGGARRRIGLPEGRPAPRPPGPPAGAERGDARTRGRRRAGGARPAADAGAAGAPGAEAARDAAR